MRFASVLALAVLVSITPSRARAADANLDPTFGTFGQTVVDVVPGVRDAAQDVLVQSDGAIVAAGFAEDEVALVRVTSTGALDAGFGTGGIVTTDVGGGSATAMAQQADGKLVVVGYAEGDAKLLTVRYDTDGTPDATFSWADLLRESKLPPEDAARQQIELFDLRNDPSESRNLAAAHPDVVRDLTARYEAYDRQAVPLVGGDKAADFKVPAVWGERTP